eukprot:GFUD01038887.1.p1 GENE.GFUD01038887.1~~GFUD01038887.1.p1  ORF type:complete len:143 (-),score=35.56 GFUD01038887.1:24-452(-)
MERNLTLSILPPPFWNWTRILEYDRNITKYHAEERDEHGDDLTSIVIVGMGILVMIVMWIFHKYSKEDRSRRCCILKSDDEESDPTIFIVNDRPTSDPVSGVAGMAAVLARVKKKDTPPPYEDPPSYDVAMQMQIVHNSDSV